MNENMRMERRCVLCSKDNVRKKQAVIALTVILNYMLHLAFAWIINVKICRSYVEVIN